MSKHSVCARMGAISCVFDIAMAVALLADATLMIASSFSFAQIHYVSNDGSPTGNGSFTNPFDKISTAYNAVSNGQNEVIKLMPGNYYETTNALVFNNDNITISGYGDQSIISNNIILCSQNTVGF